MRTPQGGTRGMARQGTARQPAAAHAYGAPCGAAAHARRIAGWTEEEEGQMKGYRFPRLSPLHINDDI